MRSILTLNPATGLKLASYRAHAPSELKIRLDRAHGAFLRWRSRPIAERCRLLRAVGARLKEKEDDLAALATAEMGKPIAQARAEVAKSATVCAYYAAHARRFLADERPPQSPAAARVVFQPLGIVLAIMPWNFPFWQVLRAAVPALAAGNTLVLKHASNVTGCALALESIFEQAGVPAGVLQALLIGTPEVATVIADPRVAGVTLTGSTRAGKEVAALAGTAMKRGVFELGGSDPYLVLRDADLELAAEICALSRLNNSGQSCICAKRFIVARSVLGEFTERFAARLSARRVGDPTDPATDVGPLARADLREALQAQVAASVKRGAQVELGGHPLPGPGFYYAPTVLTHVKPGMPAYDEELFGPVAAVIGVRDEEEAIAVANGTPFGLGAAVFSRSRRRAGEVASRLEAGSVFVNAFVRSDPTLPFGGIKESGYGRELGPHGLREFVNTKTVWVA